MSLSLTLSNALSGLNVSQRALAVLSNNVANANTPGYSRQIVEQSPQIVGSQGAGARIEQIVRRIDEYLIRAVQTQTTALGQANVVSDYMDRVQTLLGEPGADNSLDAYIESFFSTMQALAQSPEYTSFRYEAVNSGQTMAREISSLAQSMEDLRYQADSDIQDSIDIVNDEIIRLRDLNLDIYRATARGESTANLLDRRDQSLRTLSEYVDIRVNESEGGQVFIYTTNGVALLESTAYRLQYEGVHSIETFTGNGVIPPITVDAVTEDGTLAGRPVEIVSQGVDTDITTRLVSGKIKGLLDLRDHEIPNMLEQLDSIAAHLRDEFNAVHNAGSGSPAASTLSGARAIGYKDNLEWTGMARIAVLNENGTAVASRYGNTDSGYLPLEMDMEQLQSEFGNSLTVETFINEINAHFLPQNKAVVGNLNDIKIAALSNDIPDGTDFTFDFELENISSTAANFWVTNVTVLDDASANITNVTSTYPASVNLDAVNTFSTSAGSDVVTVASTAHGLSAGDVVFLSGVSGVVDGIPATDFNGKAFKITNVTANSFDIEVATQATAGLVVNDAAVSALPAYATQGAGQKSRIGSNGDITLDLSGNLASSYYTVQADVMVEDSVGNLTFTTVEYRVPNNQSDTINKRYAVRSVAAGGTMEVPTSSQPLIRAMLLDAQGNIATAGEDGYLTLVAQNIPGTTEKYTIAIDDLNSQEQGLPSNNPAQPGSGWGFSHFFGLNDFFVSNQPISTGDTLKGSALNLRVREDIVKNPNLISMGTLTQSPPPTDTTLPPDYSYERTSGSNQTAQRLALLGVTQLFFEAAGGLPSTTKSFNAYASEMLGFFGSKGAAATARQEDEQTLLDGFQTRSDAVSGVNIDEEMANTIIYQNAYSASAQVISVVKDLFETLIATF